MKTEETLALIGAKVMEMSADIKNLQKNMQRTKDSLRIIKQSVTNTENYLLLKKETPDFDL